MHKGARQLDQPLVKIPIRSFPVDQPQILENIVRLVKQLAVKAIEITEVMGIQILSLKGLDHLGDPRALVTHAPKITIQALKTNNLKGGPSGCTFLKKNIMKTKLLT